MRRKQLRIQTGLAASCLQDQIDRLWRQRPPIDIAPLVDAAEHRSRVDPGLHQPLLERFDRPTNQNDVRAVVGSCRLGAAESDGETRQERGGGIPRIGMHRLLVDQILYPQVRDLGAPAAAGGKGGQQQGAIAKIDAAVASTGGQQLCQHIVGDRSSALAAALSRRGTHGQAQCGFQGRRGK